MNMTFRWFGENNDSVSLNHIRQIPQVKGIVWSLHNKTAGEDWPEKEIQDACFQIKSHGFHADIVESINIHEDIKLGLPSRDKYIETYQNVIRNVAKEGVKVICYNFMPVFDWMRSDLSFPLEDKSLVLAYDPKLIESLSFDELLKKFGDGSLGYTLPGWEPERMTHLAATIEQYQEVNEEKLWNNLKYFLEAVIPIAKENDVKMAVHPDDPPWSIFGLPRIITNAANIRRLLKLVDDPANGLTFCTGSLGASENNNIPAMLEEFLDRSHFIHIRNVKRYPDKTFHEVSHRTQDGSVDITSVIEILSRNKKSVYVRPDHGRMIWDEKARPGYGLHDRALGIMYLWGLWDAFLSTKK